MLLRIHAGVALKGIHGQGQTKALRKHHKGKANRLSRGQKTGAELELQVSTALGIRRNVAEAHNALLVPQYSVAGSSSIPLHFLNALSPTNA